MDPDRRIFLKSLAAVSVGTVFPIALTGCRMDHRFTDSPIELFSWIVMMPDNTTILRIPQSDIGQGVVTTLSQILAEELDLRWSHVRPEFFDPLVNLQRNNVYVWTCTESSWSADRLFNPMRVAGAQIRHMLLAAAARRLGTDLSSLRTEDSSVRATSGARLSFAALAVEAAAIEPLAPEKVALKDPARYRLIGKPVKRLDLAQKASGALVYGIDIDLPDMVYATVRQSPVFGGKLNSFDAAAIAQLPGILKVVPIRGGPAGLNGPVADGGEDYGMDDAVAVVADGFWRARKGLDALPIEWDEGAFAGASSDSIRRDFEQRIAAPLPVVREEGDCFAALAGAHTVIEADYAYPFMDAMPLEPINCTAWLTPDGLQVWAPTQFAQDAHRLATDVAGLPPEKVRFNLTYAGGAFGRRCQNEYVSQAVQIAMSMPGKPVKLLWTREEMFARIYTPPATLSRFKAGLDADGNIIAWFNRVVSGRAPDQSYGPARLPHWVPNMRIEYERRTTPPPFGWMRGVGFTQHVWMNQGFQDECAVAVGRDAIDLYHALLDERTVPQGIKNRSVALDRMGNMKAVLDRAAVMSGWGAPLPHGKGRGAATSDFSYWADYRTGTAASIVDVTLDGRGELTIDRVVVVLNCGRIINPEVVRSQVEGSVVWAITNALYGEITLKDGRVVQRNFNDHNVARQSTTCRNMEIELVDSSDHPAGVGEDAVPIVMTALLNAIYAAGGHRVRSLPVRTEELAFRRS